MTEQHEDTLLLLTVPEAARRLSVSRSTLYELLDAGAIRSVRIGAGRRVPKVALVEYVEALEGYSG